MELENNNIKKVYIQLLSDTLKKKSEVLDRLLDFTGQQDSILNSDSFNEEEFMSTINSKEEQIKLLEKLDDGFEQVYQNVKAELSENKAKYTEEIEILKKWIALITDKSVKLQAMEKRNKSKLQMILAEKRKNIRRSKISCQAVSNYYKNVSMQSKEQSYFYDKKN